MSHRRRIALGIVLSFVSVGYTYFLFSRQPSNLPRTDFYAPWYGGRELLHGRSPYRSDVRDATQTFYYGHRLASGDRRDQHRFVYPAYVVLVLLPTLWLPFPLARVAMLILLLIGAYLYARISISTLKRASPDTIRVPEIMITFFVLISPPVIHGLILQQPGLLVAVMVVGALALVVYDQPAWAGMVLAVATSKPQMAVLPVMWFVLWALCGVRTRWPLLAGFLGVWTLLVGIGALLMGPGWIMEWLASLAAYRTYAGRSGAEIFFGHRVGQVLAMLTVFWLLVKVMGLRAVPARSLAFLGSTSVLLAVSVFIVPGLFALYNCILLVPGLLVATRGWIATSDSRLILPAC
jgi:Glycosyltransferase family 87